MTINITNNYSTLNSRHLFLVQYIKLAQRYLLQFTFIVAAL